jgi:hypothetical protein
VEQAGQAAAALGHRLMAEALLQELLELLTEAAVVVVEHL